MNTEKSYDRTGAFVHMFFIGLASFFTGFTFTLLFGPYSHVKKALFLLLGRAVDHDVNAVTMTEDERNAAEEFFTKPYKVKVISFKDL